MSNFSGSQFEIKEDEVASAPRIVKTCQTQAPVIQNFKFANLKESNLDLRDSSLTLAKAESRFVLSQLARDALSIGKEEERLIDERVEERLRELSEATKAHAFEIGRNEGLKEGHAEAFNAFQAECVSRVEHLNNLVQAMEAAKTRLFEDNREFLMNVIYRVAKSVLLKELSADREYLLRLSRELIERSGLRDQLTIKIHPSDAESIDMLKQGLSQSFSSLKNLTIELSENVSQGGCVLETEWGAIDASLETQLGEIVKMLDVPKGTTP